MTRQRLVFSLLLVLLAATAASANTVEYVSLEVISDSSRERYSYEHAVSNSRIQGFRMPFIRGEKHRVTIIGHLTDYLQKVQIFHGGRVVRAIWKDNLNWVGHTDEHGGKGKIVFDLDNDDLPAVGQSFQIRIRFQVEVAGFDKLDCKVVDRGKVQNAEWSTDNEAELPEYAESAQGIPRDRIRVNRTYTLKFTCFKCPSDVQIYDGITRRFLQTEVDESAMVVSGGFLQRKIRVTFTVPTYFSGGDVRPSVRFADDGMGNISGGWGDYVYSRINEQELPGRTAANPNRTNLKRVFLTSGQPGTTTTTLPPPPPPPQPPTSGCDGPAPNAAPAIEAPRDGAVCVGSPSGTLASVNFEFGAVAAACGNGSYQIEIQRLDANCSPQWTGMGTGYNEYDRCWIVDQTSDFHSWVLERATQYRWRVRANSTSTTAGAGPFSNFQTFTTGGRPAAPVFEGELSEGSQVQMGNANSTTVNARWRPSGCGQESFDIRVFEDNQQSATIQGAGNTAVIPIRRGHAYRIELVVTTNWGSSPMGALRFSTIQ